MVVQQTFTGNANQLLAELKRLESQNLKLQQGQAQHAAQSHRQHNEALKFADEQVRAAKRQALGWVTGFVSIERGIDGVKEAYAELGHLMSEVAEKAKENNIEILRSIGLAGEAARAGEIYSRLGKVPGVARSDAAAAYEGVRSGAPNALDLDKRLSLTESVSRYARLGQHIDLRQMGTHAGMMSELFPGKSPDEIADITRVAEQKLGDFAGPFFSRRQFPKIRKLVKLGVYGSEADALGELIPAASDNPTLATELEAATEKRWEKVRGHAAHTEKGKAENRLASAKTPAERAAILRSLNPEIAGELGVHWAAGASPEKSAAVAQAIREAQGNLGREETAFARTPTGAEAQANYAAETATGKVEEESYVDAEEKESRANKAFYEQFAKDHPGESGKTISAGASYWAQRSLLGLYRMAGRIAGEEDPNKFALQQMEVESENKPMSRRYASGQAAVEAGQAAEERRQSLEVQKQQLDELKKLNSRPSSAATVSGSTEE